MMKESDLKMIWEKDITKFEADAITTNSIISLSKEVLKSEYAEPMTYSDYVTYLDVLEKINYFEILELIVEKAIIEKKKLSKEEGKKILEILFFFNGVPSPLVNYYNSEGRFLADWIRKNCL